MVTRDLSLKDSLSSLDHTSPNNISSFNSANFGANSPNYLYLQFVLSYLFPPFIYEIILINYFTLFYHTIYLLLLF